VNYLGALFTNDRDVPGRNDRRNNDRVRHNNYGHSDMGNSNSDMDSTRSRSMAHSHRCSRRTARNKAPNKPAPLARLSVAPAAAAVGNLC